MEEYVAPLEDLIQKYETDPKKGLTTAQAKAALEKYGENKLQDKKHTTWLQKFFEQMKDVMVIILLVAAALSFGIALYEGSGEYIDSIIILAIVVINAVLGVQQESKAEASLDALQSMSAPIAKVVRDGMTIEIPSAQVVPGDVVLLDAGDFIPADGRLLESASLKCEESALTGESVPVEKDSLAVVEENAPLGDRINMVYSGTAATYGRGRVLVTDTGMNTEMGRIAELLNEAEPDLTPLQQRLNQMGKVLAILVLIICAIIFGIGYIQSDPNLSLIERILPALMTGVSLAVAAIPEGLTAVVTVVLAIGVQRMVDEHAIIRRLPAVETLGSASVICSDKTGTLTQNRMTVQRVWAAGHEIENMSEHLEEPALNVIRLGALCNDGTIRLQHNDEIHIGDPTETAIVAAALRNDLRKVDLDGQYQRIAELPFDSERKLMTTVHKVGDRIVSITKGGVDVLLPLSTGGDVSRVEEVNLAMAEKALRVLAVGVRELDEVPQEVTPEFLEKDLTFVGLIGMIDPPREESKQAVAECRRAGIKTVMITGDHIITASAIAKELDILRPEEGNKAITGQELQQMSEEELHEGIENYRVYARVSPEDKIRIVQAWQSRGDVVAMTGDGVNDAPALKAADIGCAMGITGTDVSKDAADMVLTDDNFATIVTAVRSGRGIYDNIVKTIQFLLGSNLGEVITVFIAMLFWKVSPLLPIHLLLVNIVTDALPALALGVEPTDSDVMLRKPIHRNQSVFADGIGLIVALCGLMVGTITLGGYYFGAFVLPTKGIGVPTHEAGMTMAFLVLAMSQLVQAWNCRSRKSLFKTGLGGNPTMVRAFAISLTVVLAICLIPPLEEIFRMVDLSLQQWGIVAVLSLSPVFFMEIGKAIAPSLRKKRA